MIAVLFLTSKNENRIDWLSRSDWTYFTGAAKYEDEVKIFPTGRVINHRDTSTAQPNPPVNLHSSHLKVTGDFRIDMEISGVDNEATVQFYGQAPIIYDEWRQERPSIRITAKNTEVKVQIWDGSSVSSIDERVFKTDLKNEINLALIKKGDQISIDVNGKILGTIPEHRIFESGTVWFGADAKQGSDGWSLRSLSVVGAKSENVEIVDLFNTKVSNDNQNALRKLSQKNDRKIPIGVAVSINPLLTDEKYKNIALGKWMKH